MASASGGNAECEAKTRPDRTSTSNGDNNIRIRPAACCFNRNRAVTPFVLEFTAAVGGLLFTMRTGAGSQQAGTGLEMLALIAPYLGGVGFGGQGTMLAAFLGATLLGLIFNGIQLLGIPVLFQSVITGAFLIGAALVGMARVRGMREAHVKERR